ncbi:MAG: PAS domain S-box protein [Chloroflexota bacterium]
MIFGVLFFTSLILLVWLLAHERWGGLRLAHILVMDRMVDRVRPLYFSLTTHTTKRLSVPSGAASLEAQSQSDERYRLLADNAPLAIGMVDLETGEVLYANPRMADLLGMPLDQLLGCRTISFYTDGEDRQRIMQLLRSEGQVTDMEVCMKKADGREYWASLTANISAFDGRPAIHTIVIDISERKAAEQDLRIKDRAIAASLNGIAIAALDGCLSYVNPAFLRLWGYEQEKDVLGMPVTDFWRQPEKALEIMQFINSGKNWEGEMTAQKKDGSLFEVQLSAALVQDESGQPLCVLGTFFDISKRKQMESELVGARKMAETLAAGVAHELNTPMKVISGSSESLIREVKNKGKLEGERFELQLNAIQRNVGRMAEIVRSLQYYAPLDHNLSRESNLNDLVKITLNLLEHQLRTMVYIDIETDLADDLPLLCCDPNKIILMLIHLINNACDALPDGGTISIHTAYQSESQRFVVKITDDGDGIPEEIQPRIFDPFFSTKPEGDGMGLGLPIVQSTVRAYKGEVQVESSQDKGTTFTIYLPLEAPNGAM